MPDFDVKSVVTTPQGVAKSGISFPGSKAFAGMTLGDVSRVMVLLWSETSLVSKKRYQCCLDVRMRKHDEKGEASMRTGGGDKDITARGYVTDT